MSGSPTEFGALIVGSDQTQLNEMRHIGDSDIFTGTPIFGHDRQKFLEGIFPAYKEASSQNKSVYHWRSPDKDTLTDNFIPYNKDYSTRHGQMFCFLQSYAPNLIAFYPQNYYSWSCKNSVEFL